VISAPERGVVADDASIADLLYAIVNPEAKRALGCVCHSFLCNHSGIEVAAREERLDGLHIQFAGIGADEISTLGTSLMALVDPSPDFLPLPLCAWSPR